MSYRITSNSHAQTREDRYTVEHILDDGSVTEHTRKTAASELDALNFALGRAAKMSLLVANPQIVEWHSNSGVRNFTVTVAEVK